MVFYIIYILFEDFFSKKQDICCIELLSTRASHWLCSGFYPKMIEFKMLTYGNVDADATNACV